MDYHSSTEKDRVRNKLLFPLFLKIAKEMNNPPVVLELVDNELESVRKYYSIDSRSKIVGITLGDHIPKMHPFTIFEGKLVDVLSRKELRSVAKGGFDFANLDFYGPGRYFDETKASYNLKLFEKFFLFQRTKEKFGLMITVDSFDHIPPHYSTILDGKKSTIELLRPSIIPKIYHFVLAKEMESYYAWLVNIAGIIMELNQVAYKKGFSLSIFGHPYLYIGKSGSHVSPMITIAIHCQNKKKQMSTTAIVEAVKKTIFLV